MAELYIKNFCFQCWLCKNRVGSDSIGHPECKVADKYMYEVYEEPCSHFEPTERVKNLIFPTADVRENVKGEWEVIDEAEPRRYGCSVCKVLSWNMSNFCPHCGADMSHNCNR